MADFGKVQLVSVWIQALAQPLWNGNQLGRHCFSFSSNHLTILGISAVPCIYCELGTRVIFSISECCASPAPFAEEAVLPLVYFPRVCRKSTDREAHWPISGLPTCLYSLPGSYIFVCILKSDSVMALMFIY